MKYLYVLIVFLVSGCALNKLYLHPDTLDRSLTQTEVYDYDTKQQMKVTLGEHFQPTFYDSLNQRIDFEYAIESVEFENQKGKLLNGWFISPEKSISNNITLFYLHGNAGNIYYQYSLMLPFVKRGFTVFMIDYSGFGYSEGKSKRKNVYSDALISFEYLKSRTELKGSKTIVYGQSLGGHLTASIGSKIQSGVDGFVIEGAFASHDEIGADASGLGWFAKMMIREIYSGEEEIKSIAKPVLIIHSTEDTTVPFRHGELLFKAANESKTFYKIDGRHILGPLLYTDSIEQKMLELLK